MSKQGELSNDSLHWTSSSKYTHDAQILYLRSFKAKVKASYKYGEIYLTSSVIKEILMWTKSTFHSKIISENEYQGC